MLGERHGPGWLLRAALARRGAIVSPLGGSWRGDLEAIRETRRRTALLMSDAAALQILVCVRAVRTLGGAMAEAGVLMGGSARLICEAKGETPLHLFDVFEGLQQAPAAAGEGIEAEVRAHFGRIYGEQTHVLRLLEGYPAVRTHPGVFPGSAGAVADQRFCFVHLDMDLVSSTEAALEFFHPRMIPGGILLGDDYDDPGVRGAFEAYFESRPETLIVLPWGQVMVVRQ